MAAPALKEWAVVVRALVAGEQIIDVRKGGLREDGRHFALRADRFWLYPTTEHERPEAVKPAYRRWVDTSKSGEHPTRIVVPGWATVAGVAHLTDPEHLDAIDSRVVWTRDYVQSRLEWKRRDALWVLALRVHRLIEPIEIPYDDSYAGCSSWVELRGLPDDPESVASEPTLTDESFAARMKLCADALPNGFGKPEPASL